MKRLIFLIFAAALAGCMKDPEAVTHAGVGGFEVGRLFTHEGCTVYRFYDGGSARYFANCNGSAETSWDRAVSCGKGCTRVEHHQVPTSQVGRQQ